MLFNHLSDFAKIRFSVSHFREFVENKKSTGCFKESFFLCILTLALPPPGALRVTSYATTYTLRQQRFQDTNLTRNHLIFTNAEPALMLGIRPMLVSYHRCEYAKLFPHPRNILHYIVLTICLLLIGVPDPYLYPLFQPEPIKHYTSWIYLSEAC